MVPSEYWTTLAVRYRYSRCIRHVRRDRKVNASHADRDALAFRHRCRSNRHRAGDLVGFEFFCAK